MEYYNNIIKDTIEQYNLIEAENNKKNLEDKLQKVLDSTNVYQLYTEYFNFLGVV